MFGGAFVAPSLIAPPLLAQHYRVASEVVRNPGLVNLLTAQENLVLFNYMTDGLCSRN